LRRGSGVKATRAKQTKGRAARGVVNEGGN